MLIHQIRFAQVQWNNRTFDHLFNSKIVVRKIKVTIRLVAVLPIICDIVTFSNLRPVVIFPARAFASTEEAQMANSRRLVDLQPTWPNLSRISSHAVEEIKS